MLGNPKCEWIFDGKGFCWRVLDRFIVRTRCARPTTRSTMAVATAAPLKTAMLLDPLCVRIDRDVPCHAHWSNRGRGSVCLLIGAWSAGTSTWCAMAVTATASFQAAVLLDPQRKGILLNRVDF
jgi:hypothetical protein